MPLVASNFIERMTGAVISELAAHGVHCEREEMRAPGVVRLNFLLHDLEHVVIVGPEFAQMYAGDALYEPIYRWERVSHDRLIESFVARLRGYLEDREWEKALPRPPGIIERWKARLLGRK